jgi:retron-type reverse transcriptase
MRIWIRIAGEIKGYFDHVDDKLLVLMLNVRIVDHRIMRFIGK